MSLIYKNGSYLRAEGTRNAFEAMSRDLEAEGLPPITVIDGDRESGEQEAGFRLRYRPATSPSDVGPYGDRRFWPGHGYWVRTSPGGTMAAPGSSNHEQRRSVDVTEPYASPGPKHSRAVAIGQRYGIQNEGATFSLNNREYWHWTFRGILGNVSGAPAGGGSVPLPTPNPNPGNKPSTSPLEDDMALVIKATTDSAWLKKGTYLADTFTAPMTVLTASEVGAHTYFGGKVAEWPARTILDLISIRGVRPSNANGRPDYTKVNY